MATAPRIEYKNSLYHVIAEVIMAERGKSYSLRQLNYHKASPLKRCQIITFDLLLLILTTYTILVEYQLP